MTQESEKLIGVREIPKSCRDCEFFDPPERACFYPDNIENFSIDDPGSDLLPEDCRIKIFFWR